MLHKVGALGIKYEVGHLLCSISSWSESNAFWDGLIPKKELNDTKFSTYSVQALTSQELLMFYPEKITQVYITCLDTKS